MTKDACSVSYNEGVGVSTALSDADAKKGKRTLERDKKAHRRSKDIVWKCSTK